MRTLLAIASVLALFLGQPAAAQIWRPDQVDDLVRAAETAPLEGLPVPEDGLAQVLLMQHLNDVDANAAPALDMVAETLFIELAQSYARGGVDPALADHDWSIPRPPAPDQNALIANLRAGAHPSVLLAGLLPASDDYRALRAELARLRADRSDPEASAHLTQVLANLERWRWLPRTLPPRRIEVRLAQYELKYFDGVNAAPTSYDVIVGAPRTPSPVFAATIESITLNPDWDPPASIVTRELLPRFRRNPAEASREGYEVLDADGNAVDAGAVNWQARPFPYHLRQLPGAHNALGRLRFDLPNPFSVYLHDTPSQTLFSRENRALSHGCIRVKAPTALAAALLGDPWSATILEDSIAQGATQTIPLSQPTPVYLLYLTAVADENGAVAYLNDINRRDAALVARLDGARGQMIASASNSACTS